MTRTTNFPDDRDPNEGIAPGEARGGGKPRTDAIDELYPFLDPKTVRDLKRIVTNRHLMPPPADQDDPQWEAAWSYFQIIYVPALRIYAYRLLRRYGFGIDAFVEAEDIVNDFVAERLESGRLRRKAGRIKKFRAWLAKQMHDFTVSWIRKRFAQRRFPLRGFAKVDAIDKLAVTTPGPTERAELREQVVMRITKLVLARIDRTSKTYALILRDRIANGGRESPELAMRLGLDPSRMADVRRRARDRFRDELIRVAREGLFAEDDISDLIDALRRLFPD
ncbi:MAG: hypothetical protein QNJ98_13830 [Planctomycetota bacterium]|nr:hypothetical protein [Planctomycetota bacterium]